MERATLIIIHTLAACVWVGGHLVLAIVILPRAWREGSTERITAFEESFEKIGIPSLLLQVITGVRLAMLMLPTSAWFGSDNPMARIIQLKLGLLVLTILLAIHARIFIIPKLTPSHIPLLGAHIIAVTCIAVALVVVGLNVRLGLF